MPAAAAVLLFLTALQAGDIRAIRQAWVDSNEARTFAAAWERRHRLRCELVHRADAGETAVDGDRATATIALDLTEEPVHPAAARRMRSERATVTLIRQRGRWLVEHYQTEEQRIAALLIDGKETIDHLLATNADAVTPELDRELALETTRAINRGDRKRARTAADLAATVAQLCGDGAGIALAAAVGGAVQSVAGNLPAFQEALARALPLAEQGGDVDVLARVINYTARPYERMNRLAEARREYERAFTYVEGVEDPLLAATLFFAIGRVEYEQGELAASLRDLRESLRAGTALGDAMLMLASESLLGVVYLRHNDFPLAIEHFERQLDIASRSGNEQYRARALMLLAQARDNLDDDAEAARLFEEALAGARAISDSVGIGETLRLRAGLRYRSGDFAGALADLAESRTIFESTKRLPFVPMILADTVSAKLQAGMDPSAVAAEAEAAAAYSHGLADAEAFIQAKTVAGKAYTKEGRGDAALQAYADAIERAEQEREVVSHEPRQQILSFEKRVAPYVETVALLVDRGRDEEALAYAERAKGRVLLDLLRKDGRVSAEAVIPAPSLAEMATLLDGAALLHFVVTDDRTFLFVVTSGARLRVHTIAIGASALAKKVKRFTSRLGQRDVRIDRESRALGALLLDAAWDELRAARTLCIVPDGALWDVPFEALRGPDGRLLVQHHACFYTPSMSVLRAIEDRHAHTAGSPSLLAVGNPAGAAGERLAPLPEAEREVLALQRLYGAGAARVHIGRASDEATVKGEMSRYSVLHFATHGRFVDGDPLSSYVVLGGSGGRDDGVLQAAELMRMHLRAELVVLSACESGRGRVGAGEGKIGMAWALSVAGCPSSVVSEWNVASAGTAELMVAFHRELLASRGERFAKAEALRRAKVRMLRGGTYGHPFYWAAFVLVGSPR